MSLLVFSTTMTKRTMRKVNNFTITRLIRGERCNNQRKVELKRSTAEDGLAVCIQVRQTWEQPKLVTQTWTQSVSLRVFNHKLAPHYHLTL